MCCQETLDVCGVEQTVNWTNQPILSAQKKHTAKVRYAFPDALDMKSYSTMSITSDSEQGASGRAMVAVPSLIRALTPIAVPFTLTA